MSTLGIVIGIALIILLTLKGVSILIAAPLASIIVIIFSNLSIVNVLLGTGSGTYMGSLGSYTMNYFVMFLLGAVLAKLMEESGATVAISENILKRIGTDNPYRVLVAIFIISIVLTYGGISVFVVMFAILPLAKSMFKKMNLEWLLIQVPFWGGVATFTMVTAPGSPSISNVIPIEYFDTSLTAASLPSILASIGAIIFCLWYMKFCLKRSLKANKGYEEPANMANVEEFTKPLPSFSKSIVPLLLLILISILGSIYGNMYENEFIKKNIVYIALLVGIVSSVILFRDKYDNIIAPFNLGATNAVGVIIATSSAVAFGSITVAMPGFESISKAVLGISSNPYISLAIITAIMSGISGSSSGALGIVLPAYSEYFLQSGANPELLHRVAAISSDILPMVPHGGAVITFLSISGLTYKNGLKEGFITVTVSSLISLAIVIATGVLFY